jgi:hypothetical protein
MEEADLGHNGLTVNGQLIDQEGAPLRRARARDMDIAVTTLTEHLLGIRNRLLSALRGVQQAHGGKEK